MTESTAPHLVVVPTAEEPKVYNPWNLTNRRIPDAEILAILRAYGIKEKPRRWDLFRPVSYTHLTLPTKRIV